MKAIVYRSNTGYTKKYAEMLAHKTGLPVYSLKDLACEGGLRCWHACSVIQSAA